MDRDPDAIHILHVDDDPDFLALSAQLLEAEDERFAVETATSAGDGEERLEAGRFDAVVSDYDMPGRTGIEFLEAVREAGHDLPFLLFTGKGSEEVASEAISAGVTDYLQKRGGTDQYTILANRVRNAVEGHRAEQEASAYRERMEAILESNPDFTFVMTADGEYVEILGGANQIGTFEPESMLGRQVRELWPEEPAEALHETIQETAETGEGQRIEYRLPVRDPDGETREAWYEGQTVHLDGEQWDDNVLLTAREVTERTRREGELRTFRKAVENAGAGIFWTDPEGTIQYVNPAFEERTGYSAAEAVGRNPRLLQSGEHDEAFYADLWETVMDGDVWRGEIVNRTKGGERYVVDQLIAPVENDAGELEHIVSVNTDITERKEREAELEALQEKSETQYRVLFEDAPVMFALTREEDGRPVIADCNRKFAETLGYDRDLLIGRPLADVYSEDAAETLLEGGGYERALRGDFLKEERELVASDGGRIQTLLRATPRRNEDGEIVGTHALFVDVTERRRADRLERENTRLEEFASIVSHDLRSPLSVASGRLELARADCDSEHLGGVEQAIDRMDALIDDLLMVAREGNSIGATRPVALAEVVEEAWGTVETGDASLVVDTTRRLRADPSRLQQLLENLVRNAVEHGDEDVSVTVGDLPDGFFVEDDGPGIPADDRERVFEMGYSDGGGTGLGLRIVAEIAEGHGWDVAVTDAAGGGARFEITGVEPVE